MMRLTAHGSMLVALCDALLLVPLYATTVVLVGGGESSIFTTTAGTDLGSHNAAIVAGAFLGGEFQAFAAQNSGLSFAGPALTAVVPSLAGTWLGSASDNSSDSGRFNGLPIWFRVTLTGAGDLDGIVYLRSTGRVFPVNTGGIGDEITISSEWLDAWDEAASTLRVSFGEDTGRLDGNGRPRSTVILSSKTEAWVEYQIWAREHGLEGENSGVDDDPDRDGIPNLMEFYLGGNPFMSDSGILPRPVLEDGSYFVVFHRAQVAKKMTFQSLEWSQDLQSWYGVNLREHNAGDVPEVEILDTGMGRELVRIPLGVGPARFVRLRLQED